MTPTIHEAMTRDALASLLGASALATVIAANKRSDLYQFSPWRHFDNGADPAALCALWRRGLGHYLRQATSACEPQKSPANRLRDRRGALIAFGYATHALQDFYSHTNWVELTLNNTGHLDNDSPHMLAPLLGDDCQPNMLAPGLQSGYFSLRYGPSGCQWCEGKPVPPPGYGFTHEELNKDTPTRGHGAERIAPDGPTYHEIARRLATSATSAVWQALCQRIEAAYGADSAERIITLLRR